MMAAFTERVSFPIELKVLLMWVILLQNYFTLLKYYSILAIKELTKSKHSKIL